MSWFIYSVPVRGAVRAQVGVGTNPGLCHPSVTQLPHWKQSLAVVVFIPVISTLLVPFVALLRC